jgi:hypothetical protein
MILRRLTENLRAQNWTAITIEFVIVVLGVFIGTWVANWNQERVEKRQTERLIAELGPALKNFVNFFETAKTYYATTGAYSKTAFAGWRNDPKVSDEQFVVAAYQASQMYTFELNGSSWATIFGSDHLRDIDDLQVRRGLASLMSNNYETLERPLATKYREQVRHVIPEDIQEAIRAQCGDYPQANLEAALVLPPTCELNLPSGDFAGAAAALRARPDLVGELRWHRAVIASYLTSIGPLEKQTRDVLRRLPSDRS